jgi:hypothetical protein
MQSAAFQGGASCIKDSAAFSFDEPQWHFKSPNTPEWYLISRATFALMPLPLVIQYHVKA